MNLMVIEQNGQRVLTTQQLAEAYGTDVKTISNNFNRNKDRYKPNKHYFLLEGDELRQFKAIHQFDEQLKFATKLYLWTEKGAWLHAKSLNTDEAWEAYERLVDEYYNVKENAINLQMLSPQLQALVALELRQKQLEKELEEAKKQVTAVQHRLDNIDRIDTIDDLRQRLNRMIQRYARQLYRAMDELLAVQPELERQVFHAVADLLNLEVDLIYFDTTSSYFEVDPSETPEGESLRKQGFSKDKRPDLVQIVIGLAVTREGIPIRAWVWPGHTMDMTVIKQVKQDLIGWKLGRVISVMDRGFSSEENLRILQQAGGHYIVGEKMRSGKAAVEEALNRRGRYQQVRENLHIKEIIVGDGEARQRYVLVYNPSEAERQRKERETLLESLKEELEGLRQLPNEAHHKATCRLRSHPSYGKYLRQLKDGTLRIDKQAVREAETYDGKYLIRTSDDTLSAEDVALGYKQLVDIEQAFRTLKSTLELRPMYHRLEDRIRAHVLLSWLALLLVRIVEIRTHESWPKVRDECERLMLGHFSSKNGDLYQRTELTAKQALFLAALGLEPPPKILGIHPRT